MRVEFMTDSVGLSEQVFLSRPISPELMSLYQLYPEILNRYTDELCNHTPGNNIGALLIELNKDLFPDYIAAVRKRRIPVIEVVRGVRISLPHDDREIRLGGADVFIKHRLTKTTGTVLNGPLAGLMLNADDLHPGCRKFTVGHVWNDYVTRHDTNFYPDFPSLMFGRTSRANYPDPNGLYTYLYRQAIADCTRALGHPPWLSDVFFMLCRQAGIPISIPDFHFARRQISSNH